MKVNFEDWKKLDLIIGEIKEVKDHPNADKLVILKVNVGDEEKQLVAGVKNYKNEELVGKKIVVLNNLEEAEIRGEKSSGMLLAADVDGKPILIVPEKDVKAGAKIR